MSEQIIEIREIYEAWGYCNNLLKQSNNLSDILAVLLEKCREYYGVCGLDCPSIQISINGNELNLGCGDVFYHLNTDEKVIGYVTKWYTSIGFNSVE